MPQAKALHRVVWIEDDFFKRMYKYWERWIFSYAKRTWAVKIWNSIDLWGFLHLLVVCWRTNYDRMDIFCIGRINTSLQLRERVGSQVLFTKAYIQGVSLIIVTSGFLQAAKQKPKKVKHNPPKLLLVKQSYKETITRTSQKHVTHRETALGIGQVGNKEVVETLLPTSIALSGVVDHHNLAKLEIHFGMLAE